jgi:hypothetical protein
MIYAMRHPDHPLKLILSSTSTQPVGERSFAVFDRLGGSRARAAAMAFWTDPNEASLNRYEEEFIPLYTRTAPTRGSLSERCAVPMRLVFVEPELCGWISCGNWTESNSPP